KQGRQVEKNRLGNEDGANGLIVQRLPNAKGMVQVVFVPPAHNRPLHITQTNVRAGQDKPESPKAYLDSYGKLPYSCTRRIKSCPLPYPLPV
ncbi:hypothetical protein, partial [Pseudomonas meliae]|uniref:hypothetical protein n=1 Tax=Pseudomonas meliae TaxID=86176 RepID=UPI001F396973